MCVCARQMLLFAFFSTLPFLSSHVGLTLSIGSSCVDYSRAGRRKKNEGHTLPATLSYVKEMQVSKMSVHENVGDLGLRTSRSELGLHALSK